MSDTPFTITFTKPIESDLELAASRRTVATLVELGESPAQILTSAADTLANPWREVDDDDTDDRGLRRIAWAAAHGMVYAMVFSGLAQQDDEAHRLSINKAEDLESVVMTEAVQNGMIGWATECTFVHGHGTADVEVDGDGRTSAVTMRDDDDDEQGAF